MKSASRWARFAAAIIVVVGLGVAGLVVPGCAPAPDASDEASTVDPMAPPVPEETAEPTAEEPAEPAPKEMAAETPAPPAKESAPAPTEEVKAPAPKESAAPAPKEPAAPAPKDSPAPPAKEPTASAPKKVEASAPKESAAPAPMESPATPAKKAAVPTPEKAEKPAAEKAADAPTVTVVVDVSKVSTFAPAKDLASQAAEYLEELEESVESEEEFADSRSKLVKHANTLILIALALGLHDSDNEYKAAAPALIKAVKELTAASDYAAAKAGVEAIQAAAAVKDGDPSTLKWEKVASLEALMEAVPLINSRLKRYLRGKRFKSAADTTAGLTAVLAVIAQGSMANADETEKPGEVEKWHAHCAQMRDAAVAVHAAIRAQDESAAEAAMEKLEKSCKDCHAVFHPEEE